MDIALDIDGDGDLLLDGNEIRLTSDVAEAAAQDVRHRLLFFRGEWFLDKRQGLPWFQNVYTKGASLTQLESLFRRAIQSSPYVTQVLDLTLTIDSKNRELSLDFDAERIDGGTVTQRRFVIEV